MSYHSLTDAQFVDAVEFRPWGPTGRELLQRFVRLVEASRLPAGSSVETKPARQIAILMAALANAAAHNDRTMQLFLATAGMVWAVAVDEVAERAAWAAIASLAGHPGSFSDDAGD